MKKRIIYEFDEMNGQGVARLYKIWPFSFQVTEWRSPMFMKNLAECRHQYLSFGPPMFFGRSWIKQMAEMLKEIEQQEAQECPQNAPQPANQ